MNKWIETLSATQKILVRTFFLILGIGLLIIVFYAGGREMLLLSDTHTEWSGMHTIFISAGVVSISISLGLNRLTAMFDIVTSGLRRLFKIDANSKNNEPDA